MLNKSITEIPSYKPLRLFFWTAVAVLCLYLSLKEVDLREVRSTILSVNIGYIWLGLVVNLIGLLLRAWRWHVLVSVGQNSIRFPNIFRSYVMGQLVNWFLPGRAGDFGRAYTIAQKTGGNSFSLGTVAVEKALDLIAYTGIFFLVMAAYPLPIWIRSAAGFVGFVGLVAVLGMIGLVRIPDRLVMVLRFILHWLPEDWQKRLIALFKSGIASLALFNHWRGVLLMSTLTGIIWLLAIFTNYVLFLAFDLNLEWITAVILLIGLQVGITLPGVPGRFGVFQYISILILGLFQIDQSTSLSYSIALQAVVLLPLIVLGITAMLQFAFHSGETNSERAVKKLQQPSNE